MQYIFMLRKILWMQYLSSDNYFKNSWKEPRYALCFADTKNAYDRVPTRELIWKNFR